MPLNPQELSDLEAWLSSPQFKGKAMRLDQLQGFLCAIISGPEPIPPSAWVMEVLGGRHKYESLEQGEKFVGLLMQFYNDVATMLEEQRPELIIKPSGKDDRLDYQTWCEGYITGWGLSTEEWLRPGNEALKKLTFPILYLSGAFNEAGGKGDASRSAEEDLAIWQKCVSVLPDGVIAIYNFWLAKRRATPIKREMPKTGRNDQCPCGSDKKFKQCCGSPERLH